MESISNNSMLFLKTSSWRKASRKSCPSFSWIGGSIFHSFAPRDSSHIGFRYSSSSHVLIKKSLSAISAEFSSKPSPTHNPHLFSVAPMLDVTNRHLHTVARMISKHVTIYTEMVVANTIIYNPELVRRDLQYHLSNLGGGGSPGTFYVPHNRHSWVLQLGGSDPETLARAIGEVHQWIEHDDAPTTPPMYDEVNLNVGCPSDKVAGKGCFGAVLMKEPQLVAKICDAMARRINYAVPVTVKCRIGVDDEESYENLCRFIESVSTQGNVHHFIIHARKAILGGLLSPAQNRSIPPLKYDYVYNLVRDFPHLKFTLNGGVKDVYQAVNHLEKKVHGVMLGRAIMDQPWHALYKVDSLIYKDLTPGISRRDLLEIYADYAEYQRLKFDTNPHTLIKPVTGIFHGEKNGKLFRRIIDEKIKEGYSMDKVLRLAITVIPDDVLDLKTTDPEPIRNTELQAARSL